MGSMGMLDIYTISKEVGEGFADIFQAIVRNEDIGIATMSKKSFQPVYDCGDGVTRTQVDFRES